MFKLTSRPPDGVGRIQCDWYNTVSELKTDLLLIADNLDVLLEGESITIERIPDPQ